MGIHAPITEEKYFKHYDFLKDFTYREGKWERKAAKISTGYFACPQPATWPATQACALTRNWTCDLSVCGMTPNPLSHVSQDQTLRFLVRRSQIALPPWLKLYAISIVRAKTFSLTLCSFSALSLLQLKTCVSLPLHQFHSVFLGASAEKTSLQLSKHGPFSLTLIAILFLLLSTPFPQSPLPSLHCRPTPFSYCSHLLFPLCCMK